MEKIEIINENKVTLYAVAVAFGMSLLVGFIRGNPAGIVFMRGFLATLFFGVIFQGGVYILRKYIPEIRGLKYSHEIEEAGNKETEDAEASTGSVVDYTTPFEDVDVPYVAEEEPVAVSPDSLDVDFLEEEGITDEEEEVPSEETEDASLGEFPSLASLFEPASDAEQESEIPEFPVEKHRSETGDYIHIGDARIPNEPKALAKAIKKVMNQG